MATDDLEPVSRGYPERRDEGAVNGIREGAPHGWRPLGLEHDSDEWHLALTWFTCRGNPARARDPHPPGLGASVYAAAESCARCAWVKPS